MAEKHGSKQHIADEVEGQDSHLERERTYWKVVPLSLLSKPTFSDMLPLVRPHILNWLNSTIDRGLSVLYRVHLNLPKPPYLP